METALDRALEVFWRKGYEGASLSDLTEAMGINRPSLYAAFGDKKTLFGKVLDRYAAGPGSFGQVILSTAPTARAAVEQLLTRAAALLPGGDHPAGCLLVHGALCGTDEATDVGTDLAHRRATTEVALRDRLDRAVTEGELPPGTDTAALAGFVMAVQQGMAVQARAGATADQLRAIVAQAMKVWPAAADISHRQAEER